MPPKTLTTEKSSSLYGESDETCVTSRFVSVFLMIDGQPPGPGEWTFLTIFNGQVVLDAKWHRGTTFEIDALPLNLKEPYHQLLVTDRPLIFILRIPAGKGSRDPDPLLSIDNRAGGTVDLFPLLLGEDEVLVKVPLVFINTGELTECTVEVQAVTSEALVEDCTTVPLTLTMMSAHCLPIARDGTVYLGAIGLDGVVEPKSVNFGMSVSFPDAEKIVWAAASNAGQAANTAFRVPYEDKFIPEDLTPSNRSECRSCYWNAMKRIQVNPNLLRERLSSPLLYELAGVPRFGKIDVRGRYMAFVDARVLLHPGQYGVTCCAKLLFYNESHLPDNVGGLLDLPPSSAKLSARDTDAIFDEYGHSAYVVIRFDLFEPLVPKLRLAALYESIGLVPSEPSAGPADGLDLPPPSEDNCIDVRKIRKEGGALAVHKELSSLACRGSVPMNQGIKRTAANRLLMRVRNMLKQFPPGECSYINWQDIVTGQHAASRRAVTASFCPQPPLVRPPARIAAARCQMAGDSRIAEANIKKSLQYFARNPRALINKALRCLEVGNDLDAKNYILEGLNTQPRNRFLLWLFGAQVFDKGAEAMEMAAAAFRVAVKGDYTDGTANAIGWGALHTLHHVNDNPYGAFVAARKMRKFYELPSEWPTFLERWTSESGEEEIYWIPAIVAADNPLLIAAAFFLCLRCYKFCDLILHCVEKGCATRGSRLSLKIKVTPDIYYVRAASLFIKHQLDKALKVTTEGILKFGPNPLLTQMKATCVIFAQDWNEKCENTLRDAEKAGAKPCPALLLRAALRRLSIDPAGSLQRAALAHKIAPCTHSALIIARIHSKMKETSLAERWAAAAVKLEPLLADGWAILALLAIFENNLDKARTMLRTAKQVGPITPDIYQEVKKAMNIVELEKLPDSLVKKLCFCDYY